MEATRRDLILQGLHFSALWPFLPSLVHASGTGQSAREGRVLVVLQLSGGNDGLNTVVPFNQDDYYRARPSLGLARGSLHRLDDEHGLHPAMGGMGELFAEGKLAIVQGAASPLADRSHFRSLEIWHTASTESPVGSVGWLGRLADQIGKQAGGTTPALAIERGNLPLSMHGESFTTPTVSDPQGFRTHKASKPLAGYRGRILEKSAAGNLGFLRQAAKATYTAAERMARISNEKQGSDYPNHELAQRLRLIASLVAGGFGTRIFHLSMNGFDTHARQQAVHQDLLGRLSSGLTAFQRDLEKKGIAGQVSTLVFSEFGRRARENGSKGTDHGRGAPLFVMGSAVRGGLHGTPPRLDQLVDGDIPGTTDFRRVYAALERDWMGLESCSAAQPLDLFQV